jgi:hypothetical protein
MTKVVTLSDPMPPQACLEHAERVHDMRPPLAHEFDEAMFKLLGES